MNNLKELAKNYFSAGIPVVPVVGKIPRGVFGWPDIRKFEDIPSGTWDNATGLGLLTGEASGLICFDWDFNLDDMEIFAAYTDFIHKFVTPQTCGIIGNRQRPVNYIFKYSEDFKKTVRYPNLKLEILSNRALKIIPPSKIEKSNEEYVFVNKVGLFLGRDEVISPQGFFNLIGRPEPKTPPNCFISPGNYLMNKKFKQLNHLLMADIDHLLPSWLPAGRFSKDKKEFRVGNLFGQRGRSLRVKINNNGSWVDFAEEGIFGHDLISLYAHIHRMKRQIDAYNALIKGYQKKPAVSSATSNPYIPEIVGPLTLNDIPKGLLLDVAEIILSDMNRPDPIYAIPAAISLVSMVVGGMVHIERVMPNVFQLLLGQDFSEKEEVVRRVQQTIGLMKGDVLMGFHFRDASDTDLLFKTKSHWPEVILFDERASFTFENLSKESGFPIWQFFAPKVSEKIHLKNGLAVVGPSMNYLGESELNYITDIFRCGGHALNAAGNFLIYNASDLPVFQQKNMLSDSAIVCAEIISVLKPLIDRFKLRDRISFISGMSKTMNFRPFELKLKEDSRTLFDNITGSIEPQIQGLYKFPHRRLVYKKYREKLLKLIAIFHLSGNIHAEMIDVEIVKMASRFLTKINMAFWETREVAESLGFYGDVFLGNPDLDAETIVKLQSKIIKKLQNGGKYTVGDLKKIRANKRNITVNLLNEMVDRTLIRRVYENQKCFFEINR